MDIYWCMEIGVGEHRLKLGKVPNLLKMVFACQKYFFFLVTEKWVSNAKFKMAPVKVFRF